VPVLSANHAVENEMAKFQVLRGFLHLALYFHRCYAILFFSQKEHGNSFVSIALFRCTGSKSIRFSFILCNQVRVLLPYHLLCNSLL
jgi:hypothetical protein